MQTTKIYRFVFLKFANNVFKKALAQLTFTRSNSTIETLEKGAR